MAYDLVQNGDEMLNDNIKRKLMNWHWSDQIPNDHPHYNSIRNYQSENQMPETTLIKHGVSSAEAKQDFQLALQMYDAEKQREGRTARGNMIAYDGNLPILYRK